MNDPAAAGHNEGVDQAVLGIADGLPPPEVQFRVHVRRSVDVSDEESIAQQLLDLADGFRVVRRQKHFAFDPGQGFSVVADRRCNAVWTLGRFGNCEYGRR